MKKFTKALALTGALMCAGVGMFACGNTDGGKALVDTKGNYNSYPEDYYQVVSRCESSVNNFTLKEGETYAIRLVYTAKSMTQTEQETYNLTTINE